MTMQPQLDFEDDAKIRILQPVISLGWANQVAAA